MRDLPVANLRDGAQVCGDFSVVRLRLERFELGLVSADTLEHLLLIFPLELELTRLLFQIGDFFVDIFDTLFYFLCAFTVEVLLKRLLLYLKPTDLAVGLFQERWLVLERDAKPRSRFVDEVDSLVRQEAVADVAR